MDHEAYENEMMDAINRHGEEAVDESAKPSNHMRNQVVTKNDAIVVIRGLKRTLFALLTIALFAISALGFITVASVQGYMAVVLFFASILGLVFAFVLLYAQGVVHIESRGESK